MVRYNRGCDDCTPLSTDAPRKASDDRIMIRQPISELLSAQSFTKTELAFLGRRVYDFQSEGNRDEGERRFEANHNICRLAISRIAQAAIAPFGDVISRGDSPRGRTNEDSEGRRVCRFKRAAARSTGYWST